MKISFSFDDGHISDLRAANLLKKYGQKATFYISNARVPGTVQLSLREVKRLFDMGMEVGGHTVSHYMDMKAIEDDEELKHEIVNNKILLEMLIAKKPITKFCYPRGRHDERVREMVRKAGFTEARTTLVLKTEFNEDPFQTGTTIHMTDRKEYWGRDWFEVALEQLEVAKSKGDKGMFHVWGHTQELDRQDDWNKFEELLKIVSLI